VEIVTTKKFRKQFKKQPLKIRREFEKRVAFFLISNNNSQLHIHKLKGIYEGLWSLNITGDIRVIFDTSRQSVVEFIAIGSHSELYS